MVWLGWTEHRASPLRSNNKAVQGQATWTCGRYTVQHVVNANHLSPFNNQLFLLGLLFFLLEVNMLYFHQSRPCRCAAVECRGHVGGRSFATYIQLALCKNHFTCLWCIITMFIICFIGWRVKCADTPAGTTEPLGLSIFCVAAVC